MNQKTLIILIAALVIICLLVIFLLLPKKAKDGEEEAAESIQIEEEPLDIPVEPEELHLELSLSVNLGAEDIISGFPIVFTVTLRNLSAEEASHLENLIVHYSENAPAEEKEKAGDSIQFWKTRLKEIPADPVAFIHEEMSINEWISFEMGSNDQFLPLPWFFRPLQQEETTSLELGKNKVHLEYLVPPEETQNISPGEYKLRAKLLSGLSEQIEGEMTSAVVHFKLLSALEADEKTLLLNHYIAGSLYLRHSQYALAKGHAQEILIKEPEKINALILLGQAKEGEGNIEEAMKTYIKALNLFAQKYPDNPPPEILMRKTREALQKKIAESAEDIK